MRSEPVRFSSKAATELAGILRTPEDGRPPYPIVVQGPGWLGVASTDSYLPYHRGFCEAGFAVLVFDYRGFGASEGSLKEIDPKEQVEDWLAAIEFVGRRAELNSERLALFGSGATGGGNAIVAAAEATPQIQAVICQVGIADGRDWLRRLHTPVEWAAFLERVERDRAQRDAGMEGAMVRARGELIPSGDSARRAAGWKRDVSDKEPLQVALATADSLFRYRPIDAVARIAPAAAMVVAVEADNVTPTDHSWALFLAAGPPKRLVLQRDTTHYQAYGDYQGQVIPMMVDWLQTHVSDDEPQEFEDSLVIVDGARNPEDSER